MAKHSKFLKSTQSSAAKTRLSPGSRRGPLPSASDSETWNTSPVQKTPTVVHLNVDVLADYQARILRVEQLMAALGKGAMDNAAAMKTFTEMMDTTPEPPTIYEDPF